MNMAKHEFGIMDIAPTLKQEYNKYEPEKYHCISVEDEYIESLLKELSVIPCYWHSLQQEERGLPTLLSVITLVGRKFVAHLHPAGAFTPDQECTC